MSRRGTPCPHSACEKGTSFRRTKSSACGLTLLQPRQSQVGAREEPHAAHRLHRLIVEEGIGRDPVLKGIAGNHDPALAIQAQDRLRQLRRLELEERAAAERHLAARDERLVDGQLLLDVHSRHRPERRAVSVDVERIVDAVHVADADDVHDLAERVELLEAAGIEAHRVDDRQQPALAHDGHVPAELPHRAEELGAHGACHEEDVRENFLQRTVGQGCGKLTHGSMGSRMRRGSANISVFPAPVKVQCARHFICLGRARQGIVPAGRRRHRQFSHPDTRRRVANAHEPAVGGLSRRPEHEARTRIRCGTSIRTESDILAPLPLNPGASYDRRNNLLWIGGYFLGWGTAQPSIGAPLFQLSARSFQPREPRPAVGAAAAARPVVEEEVLGHAARLRQPGRLAQPVRHGRRADADSARHVPDESDPDSRPRDLRGVEFRSVPDGARHGRTRWPATIPTRRRVRFETCSSATS